MPMMPPIRPATRPAHGPRNRPVTGKRTMVLNDAYPPPIGYATTGIKDPTPVRAPKSATHDSGAPRIEDMGERANSLSSASIASGFFRSFMVRLHMYLRNVADHRRGSQGWQDAA